jgi:4'-phosphopantetheinyl transferase
MPLLFKRNPVPLTQIGVWQLVETESALDSLVASSFEHDLRLTEPGNVMRTQRKAVRVLLETMTGHFKIGYDSYGKPFLTDSPLHISISHTSEFVAIIASEKPEIGIDIERVRPRMPLLADKFMADDELKALSSAYPIEHLTVYWSAKEALYKLYGKKGLIFKEQLLLEPFDYHPDSGCCKGQIRTKDMNMTFDVCYEKIGNHILSYVMNT